MQHGLTDFGFHFAFVGFILLAQVFKFEFAVELVPIVVVGSHSCLVHEADGRGAFKHGVRLCRVVVFALAPSTAAGHLTFDALLRTLRRAVEGEEGAESVLVNAVLDVADNPCFLVAERVLREAGARIEVASRIHAEHLARAAPVLVVPLWVHRFADMFREERAGVVLIIAAVDNGIGQLHQLLLKLQVVALLPNILEHHVDIHLVDTETIKMQHTLSDIGNVCRGDGDLGAATWELL